MATHSERIILCSGPPDIILTSPNRPDLPTFKCNKTIMCIIIACKWEGLGMRLAWPQLNADLTFDAGKEINVQGYI